jgi:glycosyltransferase involved in cell wall biosynthesis
MASARIAIYVRGLQNCLSFKFSQLLALGVPVVGQSIINNKDILMNNDYFTQQYAFDSPEEIVREAVKLLADPDKLNKIGRSNASIFDTKFTPQAVVTDILNILHHG